MRPLGPSPAGVVGCQGFRSDLLVQLPQRSGSLFGEQIPFRSGKASRVGEKVLLQDVSDERRPIQQLMTTGRPRSVLLNPVRSGLGRQLPHLSQAVFFDLL